MLNLKDLASSLPPYPSYRGRWTSVYLEPMMASGERFTVAVAAYGHDGKFCVHPAMRPHVIDAMFGEKAEAFNNLIGLACSSLCHHLSVNGSFDDWVPPTSGFAMGRVRETASYDLTGLLRQAVCMTASLAALDLDVGLESEAEMTAETQDRWAKQFRDAVLARQPRLSGYFHQNFHLSEEARPARIFYLSNQVAINTGRLEPGSTLPQLLQRNKAGLLDLLSIKDNNNSLININHFELIVFRPKLNNPLYSKKQIDLLSQAVETLEIIGKEHDLVVATVESADQAAERLFQAEAA